MVGLNISEKTNVMISSATHILLECLKARASHILLISFKDTEVFLVKNLSPIDPSIYGSNGQWSSEVVEVIQASTKKRNLFKPGSGLDFNEEDVQQMIDTETSELIYP